MCGIFGIWHNDFTPVDIISAQRALNLLRHRGPDDEGYLLINTTTSKVVSCSGRDTDPRLDHPPLENYLGQNFDLVLGFRRLSILDLSPTGHQPMSSADGQVWIVYNGEIYNYIELRNELICLGFVFKTQTDTEVILAAYQQWGEDCRQKIQWNVGFCYMGWETKKIILQSRSLWDKTFLLFSSDWQFYIFF